MAVWFAMCENERGDVKLITRLILLLVTFYNPALADVIKSDNGTGLITLTNEDSLYA